MPSIRNALYNNRRGNAEFLMPEVSQGIRVSERPQLDMTRIDRKELRSCYLLDPVCFKAVTTYQNLIPTYALRFDGDEEFWKEWIANSNFHHELVEALGNTTIYGESYQELIKQKGKTVGLANISPEQMDYQKENNQIKVDKHKNPVGYVQKLPYSGFETDEVKFKADQIFPLRFYDVGQGYYGVGVVEPVYNITKWKLNIIQGYAEAVQQVGFPIKYMKVGDLQHEPSKEEVQSAFNALQRINRTKCAAFPYYIDFQIQEARWALKGVIDQISFLTDLQISGLGIPKPLLTGLGSDTNRQTLIYQNLDFERTINSMREKVAFQYEEILFQKVAEEHGIKTVPRFEWEPVGLQDLSELSVRLEKYSSIGLITEDDLNGLKEKVFGWEGLPYTLSKAKPKEPKEEPEEKPPEEPEEEPKEEDGK